MLSGPLKRRETDRKQEVSVNFIAQDSAAIDRASLEVELRDRDCAVFVGGRRM